MYSKLCHSGFILFWVAWQWIAPTAAQGETSSRAAGAGEDTFFRFAAAANSMRPMETAGAHGITGSSIGAGLVSLNVSTRDGNVVTDRFQTKAADPDNGTLLTPRLWLTKGLFYPIDVGLSASSLGSANQIGAYGQWTLFEALATPAVSTRVGYSKIFGLKDSGFATQSAELVTSWGVWMVSAYLGIGVAHHDGTILSDLGEVIRSWNETQGTVGIELRILPPFVTLSADMLRYQSGESTYAAKLSFRL